MRQTKTTRLTYNEDIGDIHLNIYKRLDLNKKFQSAIKKIREEFHIKESGDLTRKEVGQLFANPKLIKKAKKLTIDMGLLSTWQPIVHEYVIWGGYYGPFFDPDALFLEARKENNKSGEDFYLHISPHTSIRDIKHVWNRVQQIVNPDGVQKRKKKSKKDYRNMRIDNLHNKGISASEIARIINKEFPEEKMYAQDVKFIVSNLKRLKEGKL